jgi:hypothetical protein
MGVGDTGDRPREAVEEPGVDPLSDDFWSIPRGDGMSDTAPEGLDELQEFEGEEPFGSSDEPDAPDEHGTQPSLYDDEDDDDDFLS